MLEPGQVPVGTRTWPGEQRTEERARPSDRASIRSSSRWSTGWKRGLVGTSAVWLLAAGR